VVPSLNSAVAAVRPLEDELKRYRLEAEETRQRLVDFISTASDIVWEMDADLRIVSTQNQVDPETPTDKAYNDSLLGKTIPEIICRDPVSDRLLAARMEDLLSARRPFRGFVHSIAGPDESLLWVEVNGNPFFSKDGTFQGYRGVARDITRRKADEARIAFLASHDSLTNLPNRMLFRERLEQSLAGMRQGKSLAVLILDLDGFKEVNDTLGAPCRRHPAAHRRRKIVLVHPEQRHGRPPGR